MISTTALAVVLGVSAAVANGQTVRGQLTQMAANTCRANPCAAKKGSNPCAANKGCNPRAVQKAGNPCGAGNPCNPCVAAGVATDCVIPRLAAAYRDGNPCAVKKVPNPCAAKKGCGPCGPRNISNPCVAKKACSPCSPCGAATKEPPALSEAEAVGAYDCVRSHMANVYAKSCHPTAIAYHNWRRFSRISYPAEAHGVRFMNNYANKTAMVDYGKWEAAGAMPSGSVLAKDSFIVGEDGKVSVGPLFLMAKGTAGMNAITRDWRYTMITPNGSVRQDAAIQTFCNKCHRRAGAEDDNLMFLPLPFRISTGAN